MLCKPFLEIIGHFLVVKASLYECFLLFIIYQFHLMVIRMHRYIVKHCFVFFNLVKPPPFFIQQFLKQFLSIGKYTKRIPKICGLLSSKRSYNDSQELLKPIFSIHQL